MDEQKYSGDTPIPTTRVVAFVDILGFRAEVIRAGPRSERVQELLGILKGLQDYGVHLSEAASEREVTAFSDCIVISEPATDDAYFTIVQLASHLATELLFRGMACRGGIAKGWLHHSDGVVFGEALVKAYELESKMAVYPRVVLDFHVAQQLIPFSLDTPWIRHDVDGIWYVNMFNNLAEHADGKSKADESAFMRMAKSIHAAHAKVAPETKAGRNWSWLRIKFDESIDYYGSQVYRIMERNLGSRDGQAESSKQSPPACPEARADAPAESAEA